jgi:hypothetical protein
MWWVILLTVQKNPKLPRTSIASGHIKWFKNIVSARINNDHVTHYNRAICFKPRPTNIYNGSHVKYNTTTATFARLHVESYGNHTTTGWG